MELVNVLNTIRENASAEYRERIPEATVDNIESIRYAMVDGDNVMVANEFVGTLLNKLVKSVVHNKMFVNPLKALKNGIKPLGDTVEEIYSNFIKGEKHDATGKALLERKLPDVKTVYHRMNSEMQYPITVTREKLSKAFASYKALERFIETTIGTLYNSAELDEFVNMKQLIKSALDNNAMKTIKIADPTKNDAAGKEFIKAVKTTSRLMTFPSTQWNAYLTAQNTDTKPITTFSRKEEQILILDAETDTSVAVDVLASVFNMTVAEFNDTRKIVIDAFPDENVRAVIVDEAFFQIYDDLYTISDFYNGQGLYRTYYLNVWQTLAYSILVNAVAFVVTSDADGDGTAETFTVEKELAEGITASNRRTSANEGAVYSTTLKGEVGSCTVTMGGANITATAYNADTKSIRIASVTGDIVITAS